MFYMSVEREFGEAENYWEETCATLTANGAVCYKKEAVAFFDTNEFEHYMVIAKTNIILDVRQQMLCREVSQ